MLDEVTESSGIAGGSVLLGTFHSEPREQVRRDLAQAVAKSFQVIVVQRALVRLWVPVQNIVEVASAEQPLEWSADRWTTFEHKGPQFPIDAMDLPESTSGGVEDFFRHREAVMSPAVVDEQAGMAQRLR